MTQHILIIGSGWLGLPLAKSLNQQGQHVTATTTSNNKVAIGDVNVIHLDTQDPKSIAALNMHFDVMIITIPPKRGLGYDYLTELTQLHHLAISLAIPHVLFTSSTSVWGNNKNIVIESSPMQPTTESAKTMVAFEQLIHDAPEYLATTIKLSGLIGCDRHPGRFLAEKTDVANPDAPVNLVVKEDVIGIISAVIQQDIWQQSLIACAPSHPSRHNFYTAAAAHLGLTPPTFTPETLLNKTIDATHTSQLLKYQYQHPDLLQWLAEHE
ncbi:NAD-dependent epimerase/dehydratase family protein [Psychrobium sp. nBUS_13]|uniref:NAD-dependent epimerase/dehydratase family protein n=1 Tax=Psychrobium sp. nBUS_13 TaxID=3395319 RepID=UPI003EB92788